LLCVTAPCAAAIARVTTDIATRRWRQTDGETDGLQYCLLKPLPRVLCFGL